MLLDDPDRGLGDSTAEPALVAPRQPRVHDSLAARKDQADIVLSADHGAGATELIDRLLEGTLPPVPRRPVSASPSGAAGPEVDVVPDA